jgi:hypothetical protein
MVTGAATTACRVDVGHADGAPAPRAAAKVSLASGPHANGTVDGVADSIGGLVDVADRRVRTTDELARRVAEHHSVAVTIRATVFHARMHMSVAALSAA